MFFYLYKVLFSGFLQFNGNFVDAQKIPWLSPFKHMENVFGVFEKLKRKYLTNIVKSSKSMLIKTGYQNLLHACDFLCFNVTTSLDRNRVREILVLCIRKEKQLLLFIPALILDRGLLKRKPLQKIMICHCFLILISIIMSFGKQS